MIWAQLLAYVTGTVDQELLLRNEYLAAENRILKAQIKGRLLLSQEEKATLAEIGHRLPIQFLPSQMAHDNFQVFDSTVSRLRWFPPNLLRAQADPIRRISPFLTAYLGLFYEPRVNRGQH